MLNNNFKTAFLFSGQGAQKTGMGQELYNNSPAAKEIFNNIKLYTGVDVANLCFNAPQEELNKTQNAQLCVFAVDLAAWASLLEKNIVPDFVAGFSLGEYAALVASGALSLEQGALIVQKRANIMSEISGGAMMAVLGAENLFLEETCEKLKSGYAICANYNCPGQTVVSGEIQAIDELEAILKNQKLKTARLSVSGAFHSKLMNNASEKLNIELNKIKFKKPEINIVLNITGELFNNSNSQDFVKIMTEQCKSPVLWEKTINTLLNLNSAKFIECGHGKVLAGFNKRIFKNSSLSNSENLVNLSVYNLESLNNI